MGNFVKAATISLSDRQVIRRQATCIPQLRYRTKRRQGCTNETQSSRESTGLEGLARFSFVLTSRAAVAGRVEVQHGRFNVIAVGLLEIQARILFQHPPASQSWHEQVYEEVTHLLSALSRNVAYAVIDKLITNPCYRCPALHAEPGRKGHGCSVMYLPVVDE